MSNFQSAQRRRIVTLLIERDGNHCHYCGCEMQTNDSTGYTVDGISIDHITPTDEGGSDDLGNLVLACRQCNGLKKTKHYQEYRFGVETNAILRFLMGGES